MRIVNLNPGADIGASAWFVEMDGHRLLMDAGLHPKREGREGLPHDLVKKTEADAVAISHCHHDHVGSLPVALQYFPKAHVLLPELSYYIVERVLHNSVNVMTRQREEAGIQEYPLYTHSEVDGMAPRFQGVKYNREVEWASFHKTRAGMTSPTLEFYDAGHALGSAGIMVRARKETLFYTGDVSFRDQTLLKGARFEDVKADVLIMETTRGNRAVPPTFSREAEENRLTEALQEVLRRKGCVLIPTFALGRTQEILGLLALLMRTGKLKRQPIYIGGLGRVFTEIYDLEAHKTHRKHSNMLLHDSLDLQVLERSKLEKMKLTGGRIFVVTSGMMNEHTVAHDLATRMIGDPRQAVFFVGYADPGTPGGRLKKSKPGEKFVFSASAGEVIRQCQLLDFDMTAHANREELLEFAGQVGPRTVILGHGDQDSMQWFADRLQEKHPRMKVLRPGPGEAVAA